MLAVLEKICNGISQGSGIAAIFAMILLLFNVFYDVIMRYAFNDVSIGMQELEWHLFSAVFLLGTPYALMKDGHVRVDILFERWNEKTKAIVNFLGALAFIFPFIILVTFYGYDFSKEAFELNEGSGDPGGLPHRWIIKGLIPLSFALMGIAGLGMAIKALRVLLGQTHYDTNNKAALS